MVVFIRHGRTPNNEVGHEKLRGWLPISLDLDGMCESRETADCLTALEDVKSLQCGTLVRVVQSAGMIAEVLCMELDAKEELNDWNTGDFAGESVQDTLDDLHDHIKHPLKKVPGGEPFQFFLDRIVPVLKEAVESDDVNIICSSGRVGTLLDALSMNKGKHPNTERLLKKPPIDPSGVFILDKNWRVVYATKKSEESKGLS